MMAEINKSPIDTLLAGVKKGILGAVGEPLGRALFNREIKTDWPYGFKSVIKPGDYTSGFEDRSLSIIKENIYKDWAAKLDLGKNRWKFTASTKFK